jgi:hypothetical protein
MSELEQWWHEQHPEPADCPFDIQQLRRLRATALLALKRDQRLWETKFSIFICEF